MLKTQSQKGSVHVVVTIVIILIIIGTLGFVFWKNYVAKNNDTAQKTHSTSKTTKASPAKKSEVSSISADLNKYVNYEQGFEFTFPKTVLAGVACTTSNTVHDTYGHEIPASKTYYTTTEGAAATTVLETSGRYIIAPKEVPVLSNIAYDGNYYLAGACKKQTTTLALVDFHNSLESSERVENYAQREFDITNVKNTDDIDTLVRKYSGDATATAIVGDLKDGRQEVTFQYGSDHITGTSGYKMWYYPAKNKVVYFSLGQAPNLESPTNTQQSYDIQVANSFKFATN